MLRPTEQQTAIVKGIMRGDHDVKIVARAGTGKTTTAIHACSVMPGSVAFFAFNKAIADELQDRAPKRVHVSTLHSLGFRALRQHYPNTRFEVDADKTYKILQNVLDGEEWKDLGALLKLVSLVKNILPMEALDAEDADLTALCDEHDLRFTLPPNRAYHIVRAVLKFTVSQMDTIDFDDMIFLPAHLELRVPTYDWVVIDEAQDVNAAQTELILRACEDGRLCMVGDPRQAIYAFRGAHEDAMDLIESARCADGYETRSYGLTRTFRCPQSVVEEAQYLVPDIEALETAEDGVVEDVDFTDLLERIRPSDMVLCRYNAQLVSLYFKLIRRNISARVLGREVGASLIELIKLLDPATLGDLEVRLKDHSNKRLEKARKEYESSPTKLLEAMTKIKDEYSTLKAVMEQSSNLTDLGSNIRRLFGTRDEQRDGVVLSSIHKAKGLEADNVWYLRTRKMKGRQEENIEYVAITRVKKALYYVWADKAAKIPIDQEQLETFASIAAKVVPSLQNQITQVVA